MAESTELQAREHHPRGRGVAWRPSPAPPARSSTPRTRLPFAVVAEGDEKDTDLAIAAARRAFDEGPWPHTPVTERAALLRRVADLLVRDRETARPAGGPRRGQDRRGGPRRHRLCRRRLPLLRRPGRRRGPRPGRGRGLARHPQRRRARADRRLRDDHALELPAAPGQLEDRPGARRRQHLRHQAERDHPADDRRGRSSCSSRPDSPPASPTSSRARPLGRRPARPSTPTSTWSPSPAAWSAAPRSPRPPRPPSRRSPSNSAARTPTSSSPTPAPPRRASTPPSTRPSTPPSSTAARSARPAPASSSRSRSGTASSPNSPAAPQKIRLGRGTEDGVECGPLVSEQQRAKIEDVRRVRPRRRAPCCAPAASAPSRPRSARRTATSTSRPSSTTATARCASYGRRSSGRSSPSRPSVPRTRPSPSPTTPSTDWRAASGPPTRAAPAAWPAGCATAPIWINDFHPYLPQAEWGGFGKSGVGRELGPAGLAEYRETKHVYQNLAPKPVRWFAG